jgi:hypothetical protein
MATVTKEKLDRLYEAYKNGTISRRKFLKYLGLAGATIGLVGSPFGNAVMMAGAGSSPRPFANTRLIHLPRPPASRLSMASLAIWTPT